MHLVQPFKTDFDKLSAENGLECKDLSLTKQSFSEDADINTIVERFKITGEVPDGYVPPDFSDFAEVADFHTAMNAIRRAQEQFMELPGQVRERFANDPQNLMAFLGDRNNLQEAVRLGLVSPPPDSSRVDSEALRAASGDPAAKGGTSSST
ncbi:internal scaffolding protein [Apis mellifera associated microvirus 1]|nr:internal scaffolding protein [Apis mellifera associated microvirus 1]